MFISVARCSAGGAHRRRPAPLLVTAALAVSTALAVAACSPAEVTVSPATTTAPACPVSPAPAADVDASDPADAAARVSAGIFECAPTVVVAAVADLEAATTVALDLGSPVLVAEDDGSLPGVSRAELERLDPDEVVVVSSDPSLPWSDSIDGAGGSWDLDVRPVPKPPDEPDDPPGTPPADDDATTSEPAAAPTTGPLWLARTPELKWATAASLAAADAAVVTADEASERVDGDVWVIGEYSPTERWQAVVPLLGEELAGGGQVVFPGRRFVAFYGSPVTFRLGLLGETGPEEALTRLDAYLAQYDTSAGPLIPTFELIVTVADSRPGDDGDYSRELTVDQVRPWIDVVTGAGGYAILDLQPGRTDFLTQARRYEELLRRPNVGLALDPEWRLEPDEVHLRQIGSVDGAEINLVVDWLAGLVRDHNLPQKLLVLHQFDWGMITNRAMVATPPELAVVLHVDGQGPLGTKYGTWQAMQDVPRGADQQLWWGWKNFLDEDSPMATPSQVDDLEPQPVVITYQ